MTELEQRFMVTVSSTLREIAGSLKTIAENGKAVEREQKEVWVVYSESVYDYEVMQRYTAVFVHEDDARKEFKELADKSRVFANEDDWVIGSDDENFFEAYPDGSWGRSHKIVDVHKVTLN